MYNYPSNYLARGIENTLFLAKNSHNITGHVIGCVVAKILGGIVFPVVLLSEFLVEPVFLAKASIKCAVGYGEAQKEWDHSLERISKLALGFFCTPLSILSSDAVSFLFLERAPSDKAVYPFGVERIYGRENLKSSVFFPSSIQEVQEFVLKARREKKKISIIGAGMSQGRQTVPSNQNDLVMDLRKLKAVSFVPDSQSTLIKAQAGAIWEEVQLEANKQGKSVISKQASDLFSVGGSLAINCHGWDHAAGAIASTVESLEVIDSEGVLRNLSMSSEDPKDVELFRCMFGTLGYFGVIVSATLKLKENEMLQEKGVSVPIEDFHKYYTGNIQTNENVPLVIGRLNLDGKPLQQLHINTYEFILPKPPFDPNKPLISENFELEPGRGQRIERIFLTAVGHLPSFLYDPAIRFFWNREVEAMNRSRVDTRNGIMHFGVKSFFLMHQSDLYTQWLQEYFVSEENLPSFLEDLGGILHENDVRLLNASIRPVPKDEISILPYAEKNRYAIVISFHQLKTDKEIEKTKLWVRQVQEKLLSKGDKWYQAYMPFATREEFERCYGEDTVNEMRRLKEVHDPLNIFSNGHTAAYFDKQEISQKEMP